MTAPITPTTASDAELLAEWRAAMEGVTPGEWFEVNPRARPGVITGDLRIQNDAGRYVATVRRGAATTVPITECDANAWWIARCSPSGIASLLDRLDKLSAEVAAKDAELVKLADPTAVHVNLLAGRIAKPNEAQILHVYPGIRDRLTAAEAEAAGLREALVPFGDSHVAENVDANGWTSRIGHERIVDWFGPSDFRAARAALTPRMEADNAG